MPYTAEKLRKLFVPQLKEILDEMSEPTTGLKNDLIERIFADQVQNPDVTLLMDGPSATTSTSPSAPITSSSASSVAFPLSDSIAALVHRLDLRQHAIAILEAAGFTSSFDVKLMSHEDIGTLGLLFADVFKIQNWLKEGEILPQALPVNPHPALLPTPHPHNRLPLHALSGEIDGESGEEEYNYVLPTKHARDLPRPHESINPKNGSGEKKVSALNISLNEFFVESIELLSRLNASEEYAEVRQEYTDYLKFLSYKRLDYVDNAVLKFDDEFRQEIKHTRGSLTDNDARRTLSDRYFHSLTRTGSQTFTNTNNQRIYSPRQSAPFGTEGPGNPASNKTCNKWQTGDCRGPCYYAHCCATCGGNHRGTSCANQRQGGKR